MKHHLTKMILSTVVVLILSGCDNTTSSVQESTIESQNTLESEECADSGSTNSVSPFEPITARECSID